MRNLQILLEQSNLWKGEFAQSHFGQRNGKQFPLRCAGRLPSLSGRQT